MISVYTASIETLADKAVFEGYYGEAPEERRRKIDRLLFDKDKKDSLGAWVLLERAFADIGRDVRELTFLTDEHGKPHVEGDEVHFSISHSKGRVMCALSDRPVGCDVEKIDEVDFAIAKRFFPREDYDAIVSGGGTDLFYRIWTVRESFTKLIGTGLSLPLNSFSVSFDDGKVRHDGEEYSFREYDLGDGFKRAVVTSFKRIPQIKTVSI